MILTSSKEREYTYLYKDWKFEYTEVSLLHDVTYTGVHAYTFLHFLYASAAVICVTGELGGVEYD